MTNRLRICLVSREYPPDTGWGGVGAYTYQIAHGLVENGHEVDVIALCAERGRVVSNSLLEKPDERIRVHRVEWENSLEELNLLLVATPSAHFVIKSGIALWRKFIELHQKQPFDVVEAPEHLAAGVFQSITGVVPLVVKLHTPHSKFVVEKYHGVLPTLDNQLICLLERITMLSADGLCSPSADLARFVAEDLNVPDASIRMVRNPVDVDRFSPEGQRVITDEGKLTILFVGRIEPRKGIQHLIDAVPTICARHANVKFVVVGADTNTGNAGGSMLQELKKRLQASNCESKVSFVPHVPLSEIPNFYRSADICVVPSLYENAPYTCIEAMSCGKPVVTTSAGGSSEYVSHGKFGLVVPAGSAEVLSDAIYTLISDASARSNYGAAARKFAVENLDRRRIAREMEDTYLTAIQAHRTAQKLYRKPASQALRDTLDLLCAFEQMLFDTMYKLSFEFRCKYWLRFFARRPGLCAATLSLSSMKALLKLFGAELKQPLFVQRLEQVVQSKQAPRFGLTMLVSESSKERNTTEPNALACEKSPVSG